MLWTLANKRRHTNCLWRLDLYRKELKLAFTKVVSRFAEVGEFWQLRARTLAVRALQREFDLLPT